MKKTQRHDGGLSVAAATIGAVGQEYCWAKALSLPISVFGHDWHILDCPFGVKACCQEGNAQLLSHGLDLHSHACSVMLLCSRSGVLQSSLVKSSVQLSLKDDMAPHCFRRHALK